ncbi:hypothetical protein VTK73DRAFT_3334 [Phialemonium thermophilum]|uniref:Uncharacterized protein n=1 Tax=Phialemonium thermophilum TaxID=223376 RepID=A0ABR3VJW3_9PEZI
MATIPSSPPACPRSRGSNSHPEAYVYCTPGLMQGLFAGISKVGTRTLGKCKPYEHKPEPAFAVGCLLPRPLIKHLDVQIQPRTAIQADRSSVTTRRGGRRPVIPAKGVRGSGGSWQGHDSRTGMSRCQARCALSEWPDVMECPVLYFLAHQPNQPNMLIKSTVHEWPPCLTTKA